METATTTALPIGDKAELPKLPPKRVAKGGQPIRSLPPSESGPVIKSHRPLPMTTFPNSTKQTKTKKPTPEQLTRSTKSSLEQAYAVKEAIVPAMLATVLGIENTIGASGYRIYLDDLIRDSGSPTDRVEIMLLEQIVMCHHRSMQMQTLAEKAQGTEAIEMYLAAGSRLSAEFRKSVLALKEYRRK